jgi:glycosyltransferase involved in cell wall biosynthesis
MLRGLAGSTPLPVLNYTSSAMSQKVAEAASQPFDLIHADSIHMIGYAELAALAQPKAAVMYNWHNIESEAMRRFGGTTASRAKAWYAAQTAAKLEALERRILKTAQGHVVCSEREREALSALASGARIEVVENGVDTAAFRGIGSASAHSTRLVFVGTMDYFPNVDAVTSFAARVWPRLTKLMPEATLSIVGANPVPEVLALRGISGIEVTGTVPDVRPYYRDALAAIVPLRTGGGTRLKILEAMAAGVPVISTPLGAEGLAATPDRDILIANPDDAECWGRQVRRLVNGAERSRLTEAAADLVRVRYDWETLGAKLAATYLRWLNGNP